MRTEARRLRNKLVEYYASEGLTNFTRHRAAERELPARLSGRVPLKVVPVKASPNAPAISRLARGTTARCRNRSGCKGVAAAYWLWNRGTPTGRDRTSIPSIAVLPLENLSADAEQEYFSDGLTDELITDLAKLRGLRVISRTSVLPYKRVKRPLPEIARQLGVDYVVEGTIRGSSERVRITAQLIAVRNEHHVWADTFERDRRDALALQGEVARTIAEPDPYSRHTTGGSAG